MGKFTLGIIGCGNMGRAIAKGIITNNILNGDSVYLFDKDASKAEGLSEETGCAQVDLSQMVRGSDILLIAVKPQDFGALAGEISEDITEQTIVSVMAGLKIDTITKKIGKEIPVVRVMPNMGAFIGESVSCISFNDKVILVQEVKDIFFGVGKVIEVEEKLMDAVTALSGSGPAYLFYLASCMINVGKNMGLSEGQAKDLVSQTLFGAALLLKDSGDSAEELVAKVASKGGTTEAALKVFDEQGVRDIVKDAINRARERSEELSEG